MYSIIYSKGTVMSKKNKNQRVKGAQISQEERIRQLTKENIRLRNEIATLKNEIQQGSAATRRFTKKRDSVQSMFFHQARRENTFSQKTHFAYFRHALKNASLLRFYSKIVNTVRHFTFVNTAIKIVLFILTIVKSGAIFLISTSTFIVSFPFMFLLSGIGAMLTMLGSHKATKTNRPILTDKNVCVFFPAKKSAIRDGTYFSGFVKSMSEQPDTVCIIVTQGFFFSRGISGNKKFFLASRVDSDNVIIVRRHYYFKLKQSIILPKSKKLTEIY